MVVDEHETSVLSMFAQEELAQLSEAVKAAKGRLFVHCEVGVNRSGSLCLAHHATRRLL